MPLDLQDAITYVRSVSKHQVDFDEDRYLEALESLVDQRAQLTQNVYIDLPGGRNGNSNPKWDKVKAGSDERCSCGNERVIRPGNFRTTFEPAEVSVTVSQTNTVFLRPIGGDKASAYIKLKVENEALTFLEDPFAPFILTPDIFSTRGFQLSDLAELLPKQPTPPIFINGKTKMSLFAINAVNPMAQTVTITPDREIEVFDPSQEDNTHHHGENTQEV